MNKLKTILFANGRPTPPITFGGDSVSIKILFQYLHNKKYNCYAFGALNPEYSSRHNIHNTTDIRNSLKRLNISYKFSKNWLQVKLCSHVRNRYLAIQRTIEYAKPFHCRMVRTEFFSKELDAYIQQIQPDIVITQVDRTEEVVLLAKKYNIPVIVIIQDFESENLIRIDAANSYHKAAILFISDAVKKQFVHHCKVLIDVWHHPLGKKTTQLKNKSSRKYVTMVNPVLIKGGKIFQNIALALPKIKFMTVLNWNDPENNGVDFSGTKNVIVIPRVDNMSAIYKKTKLLLVPSLWQEAFGRVVIEAASYGIPAIASNSGGLKEAVGEGGVVINNYLDIQLWATTILNSLKPSQYKKLSKLASRHSVLFREDNQCRKFEVIMNKHFNSFNNQY